MSKDVNFAHLTAFESVEQLSAFDVMPDPVWVFDVDAYGFWWGNARAVEYWGLEHYQQLVDKDLSSDTDGARNRIRGIFEKASQEGMTSDPWTTYPNGEATTVLIRHKAVLLGPQRHRGIIGFVLEEHQLGEAEQLLFAEATRYASVAVTSYTLDGDLLFENPASANLYGYDSRDNLPENVSLFESRFSDPQEARERLEKGRKGEDCRHTHLMVPRHGVQRHAVDIRSSRHPITGEYLMLVSEYDVTALHNALQEAELAKDELKKLANYDALTNLPGVRLCKQRIDRAVDTARANDHRFALMFLDLDGFKAINDTYGHLIGDDLLKVIARRLSGIVRESDTVGRIGGDEFIILLEHISCQEVAVVIAREILQIFAEPFRVISECGADLRLDVGVSIGISVFPDYAADAKELFCQADQAMYQVKQAGKNNFSLADTAEC
ncbi:sensor domain-containing diguanylate cyclase [Aliamphritea hakodatensis]|uniref:sensor domain-containing diguanylate cyclase n=1 Tax=Aliamphritea hakodatensis TaxID=2895352 RepID=UPI0022FD8FD9|nr:sensor domain-containing diguanylate cyclase [Aliamphritea hakodatensis]